MIDNAEAHEQWQPQRSGEAKRMEERQHSEHHVVGVQLVDLINRINVGQDTAMRQHHALRDAGTAAREDNRRELLAVRLAYEEAIERPRGQQKRAEEHARFRGRPDRSKDILDEKHAFDRLDADLGQKRPRRQNRLDVAAIDRVRHRFPARREVQVHSHFAGE